MPPQVRTPRVRTRLARTPQARTRPAEPDVAIVAVAAVVAAIVAVVAVAATPVPPRAAVHHQHAVQVERAQADRAPRRLLAERRQLVRNSRVAGGELAAVALQ